MLLQCVSELEQLPPLMSAAYLRSNEAQRARWASVFEFYGMYTLRARVVMADEPKPAPEKLDQMSWRDSHYSFTHGSYQGLDKQARIDFMDGTESTPAFEDIINKWIQEGWKFDWIFGTIFANNATKPDWAHYIRTHYPFTAQSTPVDSWTSSLMNSQDKFFIPRMEMLLQHGINPMITSRDLNFAIPNVRRMKREDHVKLEVLSSNIQFIIDNKIKIGFDNCGKLHAIENPSIRMIMLAIGNAYVDLPYAIERWEHELKPDSSQQLLDTNTESTYTEHFRRYKETVPQLLVQLVMHLAQSHGSNAWEAARDNTMSHFLNGGYLFFTEEHESAFRMALFDTGGNVETGPIFKTAEQREWDPVDHYDDAVKQLVLGPSESFITRMQELPNQNKKPVLNSRDLNLVIPNVRRMKLKDHKQLEFLSNNIKFIVDKKIKIVFDSHPHTSENPSIRMIMRAIGNACVDLPYTMEHWGDDLKRERFETRWLREPKPPHFRQYETIVPQRLAQLVVHLATQHGSNVWNAVCKNTMSHFVRGGYLRVPAVGGWNWHHLVQDTKELVQTMEELFKGDGDGGGHLVHASLLCGGLTTAQQREWSPTGLCPKS